MDSGQPRTTPTPDSRRAERASGHPSAFGRGAFGELRKLHGDEAVWKLIEAYPERVPRVEIPAEPPPDVDAPEDYETALSHWRDGA